MAEKYILQPTTQHILWGGAVEILCFGRDTGDWSLRDEVPEMPGYPRPEVVEAIGRLANAYDCRIYAPKTSAFNAQIVEARELADALVEDRFFRGVEADGVILREPRQAFAVSSADCPTFVLWDSITSTVVATHAGRDSLIPPRLVTGAYRRWDRGPRSAIQNAISAMPMSGLHGGNSRFGSFVTCGIGPTHFEHPMRNPHGANKGNNALVKWIRITYGDDCLRGDPAHGMVNLNHIIRRQCIQKGMYPERIGYDGVDTFADRYPDGGHMWHSHRRNGDGTRNLVLVVRRR